MLPGNRAKIKALITEARDFIDNPNVSTKAIKVRMDEFERECADIEAADAKSKEYRSNYGVGPGDDTSTTARTKAVGGPKWNPPAPWHASEEQVESLWLAAKNRLPSYSFELGEKAAPSWNVRTKQVVEGAPGSLLPPALLPERNVEFAVWA